MRQNFSGVGVFNIRQFYLHRSFQLLSLKSLLLVTIHIKQVLQIWKINEIKKPMQFGPNQAQVLLTSQGWILSLTEHTISSTQNLG